MKKDKVLLNSTTGIIYRVLALLLGMIFRRIFIMHMGQELSGLTGLYANVIDFLKIALAGVGNSALYQLYHCNATGDEEKRRKIYFFATRFYCLVSVLIFILGLLFSFKIDFLIKDNSYSTSFLRTVFILQVLSQSIPMLFSFYQSALRAYEEQYINNIVSCVTDIIVYAVQIFVIVATGNYYIYLVTIIVRYTIPSVVVFFLSRKTHCIGRYHGKFSFKELLSTFSDLRSTIVGQISNFIFLATDSIVISKFVGLIAVNLYSNYMIIINALIAFFDEINAAVQSRVGNILAKNGTEEEIYKCIKKNILCQHLLLSFAAFSFLLLVDTFMNMWLGKECVLPLETVLFFYINYVVYEFNMPLKTMAQAMGLFDDEKRTTGTGAIVNIISSIFLVTILNINGVIIGSIIGNSIMLIMRGIMYKEKTGIYFGKLLKMFALIFMAYLLMMLLGIVGLKLIVEMSPLIQILVKILSCAMIPVIINYVTFGQDTDLHLMIERIRRGKNAQRKN